MIATDDSGRSHGTARIEGVLPLRFTRYKKGESNMKSVVGVRVDFGMSYGVDSVYLTRKMAGRLVEELEAALEVIAEYKREKETD